MRVCTFLAAGLMTISSLALAQTGNTNRISNGPTTYNQVGNTTYGSDGSIANRNGNTTTTNDGRSYNQIGTSTYGSDGSTGNRVGNTTFVQTPSGQQRTCQTIGTTTICN